MTETLKMRVNVDFGFTCPGRYIGKSEEFELPVSLEEKQLLENLPSCEDGKTTDLQAVIPEELYKRMRDAAINKVKDIVYEDGYRNGMYELDVHKWFELDLKHEAFCKCIGDGKYKIDGDDTVYCEDDEELFEKWLDHEDEDFEEGGIEYLREKYEDELREQTDISSVDWSMEF